MDAVIYHLALAADWEEAKRVGEYRVSTLGRTLDDEGFIHCSFRHQVQAIADLVYRGRDDVALLVVAVRSLEAEVRVEGLGGTGEEFPHIFGPLPVACVLEVHVLRRAFDGRLEVEAALGR